MQNYKNYTIILGEFPTKLFETSQTVGCRLEAVDCRLEAGGCRL